MTPEEMYREAFDKWGMDAQLEMVIEECSEMIVAICHWRRDKVTHSEICEEIADVTIMLEQLIILLDLLFPEENINDLVATIKAQKLQRLQELLKG